MAFDPFASNGYAPNMVGRRSWDLTGLISDTVDLPAAIRKVTIGTAGGTIRWQNSLGEVQNTGPLPVGEYTMAAHRIMATGTTATGLTGWE